MEPKEYLVIGIDGDYGILREADAAEGEEFSVAMALLPAGVDTGCRLRYECLEYSLL